jgi:glycosyltransferase involved in cell wall biosynthesis
MRLPIASTRGIRATSVGDGRTPARRVLMLVSGFPPAREYILRTVKFAKYLPEWGWTPVVVTPFRKAGTSGEPLVAVPNGIVVRRTPHVPTLSALAGWVRMGKDGAGGVVSSAALATKTRKISRGVGTGVRRMLLWGDTPDAFAGWIPFAVVTGWWLARRHEVSAIHVSGPPFSVLCAGAELSRLTGLPLIADFRDAWTLDSSDPFGTLTGQFRERSRMKVRFLKILERRVLRRSSAVLFTSRATRALYLDEYPEIEAKSRVIYNGADPDDFTGEVPALERPTVAHIGTLHEYQWDQVEIFLGGFARALRAAKVPADAQLVFAGAIGRRLRARLEASVRNWEINRFVQVTDFVPHAQAVRWMRGSRVLLLFAGTNPYIRLSKISEYVAAGAYMLAFASGESETAEEVRLYGGRVLSGASEDAVAAELAMAFSTQSDGRPRLQNIEHPHPLNRRTEAQYLADILDRSVATVGAPGGASR